VSSIEQIFDIRLPAISLFEHGATIAQLAETITSYMEGKTSSLLITVQATGSKPPFVFLHDEGEWGGFFATRFARYLDPDQPYYILHTESVAQPPVDVSVEDMTAVHLQSLRSILPHGPYRLGGFCGGAVLAFEMARQLEAAGENIDVAILIDLPPIPARVRFVRRLVGRSGMSDTQQIRTFCRVQRVVRVLVRILGTRGEDRRAYLRRIAMKAVSHAAQKLRRAGLPFADLGGGPAIEQGWDPTYPLAWAFAKYRFEPYGGAVALLCTRDEYPFRREEPDALLRRWKTLAAALELHVIPGNHGTCKTEHLPEMAGKINRCLNRGTASHSSNVKGEF
jgi:thioesterase domain-containing protein